jgi:hypothetical protein
MTLLFFCGEPPSESEDKSTDATIFFASIPPVAEVYADDVLIGKTNIAAIPVNSGRYKITFKKDSLQFDTTMTIKPGKNPSVMVRFDGN